MTKYTAKDIPNLIRKLEGKEKMINQAAAQTLNRGATFARAETVKAINAEVTLDIPYIRRHIKTVARAAPTNLRTVVRANAKGTHLTRYEYRVDGKDILVKINRGGGSRRLRNAFTVTNLKGSQSKGIAMRNRDAVHYFNSTATSAQSRRKQRQIAKARNKPNGITVLHSRSINQMFLSQRDNVRPALSAFMRDEFQLQFNRLKNK